MWLGEEMDHFAGSGLYPWEFKSRLAAYAYRFIILRFQAYQISAQTDHYWLRYDCSRKGTFGFFPIHERIVQQPDTSCRSKFYGSVGQDVPIMIFCGDSDAVIGLH